MRTSGNKSVLNVQGRVRGGGIIGLLVVLVIILILTVFFSPLSKEDQRNITQAQGYQERARDSVCRMNLDNVRTRITEFQLANPGVVVTPLMMEKKGFPLCPDGGEYVIKNGQVYCTKHFPPPPDPTPAGAAAATTATAATTASAH